ncbi:MAG TPA: hypothetical protein VJJ83_01975 [Candidatus Babeliales bacterium]|nr:hypothetical protein [Candidatus Babeliales bacterium]
MLKHLLFIISLTVTTLNWAIDAEHRPVTADVVHHYQELCGSLKVHPITTEISWGSSVKVFSGMWMKKDDPAVITTELFAQRDEIITPDSALLPLEKETLRGRLLLAAAKAIRKQRISERLAKIEIDQHTYFTKPRFYGADSRQGGITYQTVIPAKLATEAVISGQIVKAYDHHQSLKKHLELIRDLEYYEAYPCCQLYPTDIPNLFTLETTIYGSRERLTGTTAIAPLTQLPTTITSRLGSSGWTSDIDTVKFDATTKCNAPVYYDRDKGWMSVKTLVTRYDLETPVRQLAKLTTPAGAAATPTSVAFESASMTESITADGVVRVGGWEWKLDLGIR